MLNVFIKIILSNSLNNLTELARVALAADRKKTRDKERERVR